MKTKVRDENDYFIWARTVMGEARNQSVLGQVAVAWVIKNRVNNPKWWGSDVGSVCLAPQQFSCWNPDDPNRTLIDKVGLESDAFRRALGIILLVDRGDMQDPTGGATHYFATYIPEPAWAKEMETLTQIGTHRFFKEK